MDRAAIARMRMRAQALWSSTLGPPEEALAELLALQSQEFAYARWSLAQRSGHFASSAVQRAFDDGRILRTHILRPTWHFVAPADLRWLMRLSGPRVVAACARRCTELGLDPKTLVETSEIVARAVEPGPITRRALASILKGRGFHPDGQRMVYILMRAELDMIVCSGPLEGNQHTYAAFDDRVTPGLPLDRDDALGRLAKRYFASRGPATLRDFNWWSGLPMSDVRRAIEIAGSELERVEAADRTYYGVEPMSDRRASAPQVDLVQRYDETIISYSESRDVLQTARARFPVPANIDGYAHVVLRDGRLLGHWRAVRARNSVTVETRIAERLDIRARAALDRAVARYERFARS